MGIIVDENSRVVVQGITGKEGRRMTEDMLAAKTRVVCGVTPGRGGMQVEGLPVFDSVQEAKQHDEHLNTSVISVPPLMVLDAACEAIDAGLETVLIVTENVPIKDTALIIEAARGADVCLIGPSSVGLISPGVGKLGSIGSDPTVYSKGDVGVISKSGGMCAETACLLTAEGIGQSTVIGIGGDVLVGSTFVDLMELFGQDRDTKALVLFGEIGGSYEELAAEKICSKEWTKPVVAYVSGKFAESMNLVLAVGHAGALMEFGAGGVEQKKRVLREAGVLVADYHDEIPHLVRKVL